MLRLQNLEELDRQFWVCRSDSEDSKMPRLGLDLPTPSLDLTPPPPIAHRDVQAVSTPGTKEYLQFKTVDQLAGLIGARDADIAAATQVRWCTVVEVGGLWKGEVVEVGSGGAATVVST